MQLPDLLGACSADKPEQVQKSSGTEFPNRQKVDIKSKLNSSVTVRR
jgi:hypothetical protein